MYWDSMRGKQVREELLDSDSPATRDEYQKVHNKFSSTLVNKTLLKIHRIQNTDRWDPFAV